VSGFAGELRHAPWGYRQSMLLGNPALYFDRLARDFGDFVHVKGLLDFYFVNHPALVKRLLTETNRTFDKRSIIYDRFRNAFGDGLVVSEGDRWKRQRRMMQPTFKPGAVRSFFDLMLDEAHTMTGRWEKDSPFDIAEDMQRVTLAIAGRALFSNGFTNVSHHIERWTHVINRYSAKPPVPIVTDLWFPSPTNRRLKTALREFRQFVGQLIVERRQSEPKNDLLGILLEARDQDSGAHMSNVEIMEEVLGMIIGGHETSSAALTWLWYELHHNPDVAERLTAEIDEITGGDPLTVETAAQLPYLKTVLDETMRLHPPFWFENRNAVEDVSLGGIDIERGTMVAFSRYSLHRHPDFWQEPDAFRPERFVKDNMENERSSFAHVPFGGGPRICIGINFAMLELIAIVATVLPRYRVVIDASDRHLMWAHLTMYPKHGLRVRAIRR
jgi:cytochrome P450